MRWRLCVVALLVAATACGGRGTGVARARSTLNDSGRFGNGPKSADAFAAIASELLRAGRGCRAPRKHDERRCLALFEAAGAAETTGGFLVNCTAPGIFEARSLWRGYLDAVAQYERHPTEVRPAIPKVPSCD